MIELERENDYDNKSQKVIKYFIEEIDETIDIKHILKKDKDIVVKIGDENIIKTEWGMIKHLRKYVPIGLPKYICYPKKYNKKLVIQMPYYPIGNINNIVWTDKNLIILHSLINQIFISMFLNFHYFGFIYNNLSKPNCVKNILIKENNNTSTSTSTSSICISYRSPYENIIRMLRVKTYGYEANIVDFEDCFYVLKKDNGDRYWSSVYDFINNMNNSIFIPNNIKVSNLDDIFMFIKKEIENNGDYDNSVALHILLLKSKYTMLESC
jgi:hypothetical protein